MKDETLGKKEAIEMTTKIYPLPKKVKAKLISMAPKNEVELKKLLKKIDEGYAKLGVRT